MSTCKHRIVMYRAASVAPSPPSQSVPGSIRDAFSAASHVSTGIYWKSTEQCSSSRKDNESVQASSFRSAAYPQVESAKSTLRCFSNGVLFPPEERPCPRLFSWLLLRPLPCRSPLSLVVSLLRVGIFRLVDPKKEVSLRERKKRRSLNGNFPTSYFQPY